MVESDSLASRDRMVRMRAGDAYSEQDAACQRCVRSMEAAVRGDALSVAFRPVEAVLTAFVEADGDGMNWSTVFDEIRAGRPTCAEKCSKAAVMPGWNLKDVVSVTGAEVLSVLKRRLGRFL